VKKTFFTHIDKAGRRLVIHFFNGLNTAANHGLPATDVPLREETISIHGMRVRDAQGLTRATSALVISGVFCHALPFIVLNVRPP
jgi:hypothetical protein